MSRQPPKNYIPDNIFGRSKDDPSKTYLVCGRSYSGKTHFLVQQLNKLSGKTQGNKWPLTKRPVYDLIIFMTESTDADPLKDLDPALNTLLIRGYYPRVVMLIKKIQDMSKRSFRFLVVLDDIVDNIRDGTARKQILTLRNSHISTCILAQYVKLISPAMRNSIHEWYVTGLKPEEYEYLLQGFLSSHARDILGNIRNMSQLASEFMMYIGSDILYYSQREDKLAFIKRAEWRKG
jgi:hypothetical protein